METITVTFENGTQREVETGTPVSALLPSSPASNGLPFLAALVNNDVSSLSYPLTVNCEVCFLTAKDPHGWRVYRRSLCFLLAKAVHDLFPSAQLTVEHALGSGLYATLVTPGTSPSGGVTADLVRRIETHMRELVVRRLPIERRKIAFTDAVREFEQSGQHDKLNLLKFRNPPRIVMHWCDGFSDLAHGPLVPHTGILAPFELIPYPPGFVLNLPQADDPLRIPPFEDQPHLFQIIHEHKEWGRILGVRTVGDLNAIIADGDIEDFVLTAEALHEKKLAAIAETIARARPPVRLVLIAGPSSAGKTTLAKRLQPHLRVNGLRPVTLSTDNYFVGEDRNPRTEDGQPDYEHIEALDLPLLHDHLARLIAGEEVATPIFDFVARRRDRRRQSLRLEEDQILIMEGIHGLNPRLTASVPAERKFRIYVNALTQLNVDSHNRISTTDNRLMRRLVRDRKFRGHTGLQTLRQWPLVRRGEERWIFPFQKEADATFNAALDYELAVLKPYVEATLMEVKPSHREYAEARRLTEFLLNFLPVSDRVVPPTSILREYIGGSRFHY